MISEVKNTTVICFWFAFVFIFSILIL
jgi:hypothetical protein